MCMGLNDISAEMVVNSFSENTLKLIIKILGEEKDASRIVKNIIKFRGYKKNYQSKSISNNYRKK